MRIGVAALLSAVICIVFLERRGRYSNEVDRWFQLWEKADRNRIREAIAHSGSRAIITCAIKVISRNGLMDEYLKETDTISDNSYPPIRQFP